MAWVEKNAGAVGYATEAVPTRAPEVDAQLERLRGAVDRAGKAAGALFDRLVPVQSPPMTGSNQTDEPVPALCSVADAIRQQAREIDGLADALIVNRDRLEI